MIYVTGDMHGDIKRFKERKIKRLKENDVLIILGDFGFIWDAGESEKQSLEYIGSRKYKVLFVDGTHENHDLLKQYPETEIFGGRARHITGNLYLLMRGEIFDIEGKKFFALGGGRSDDLEFRIEGESWWSSELPDASEIENARRNLAKYDKVDYIVTHDAPHKLKSSFLPEVGDKNHADGFLDEIMMQGHYTRWYFGKYHTDRKITRSQYAVYRNVIEVEHPEKKSFFRKFFKKKK